MIFRILMSSLVLLILSCHQTEKITPDPIPHSEDTSSVPTIIPEGNEQYLQLDSDYIFDQNNLNTYELIIPDESLAFIDSDPAAEEYVAGSLVFQGDTISPVGIRYKGSIGAFVGCVSGNDFTEPSGYKTCTKLSMKVKINWEGRDEKFYGLKKIQFHSQNQDRSQMRDRLGYWLFREMGVAAPRAVHAKLIINGTYTGLFSLIEHIDGRFTRYNFDDGEGNLYKEIWPLTKEGKAQNELNYLAHLETNKDENPSAEIIRTFGENLEKTDEPSALKSLVAESMDIDKIMAYWVVDRMIRHDDGPYHWYCTGNECSNHNYYWYEEPIRKKIHLIPWDLDNAFANIIANSNPVTPVADKWGEITNDCEVFSYGIFAVRQWSASCDKLTATWVNYENEYQQLRQTFINTSFSQASIDDRLEVWYNQIETATLEASELYGDAVTPSEWQQAISTLKSQVNYARIN